LAIESLKELSKDFEIIVFTASHSCYAHKVLDYLDPKGNFIHCKVYRENCIQTSEGLYLKDLRIFSNRDIENIAIIDNATYSFGLNLDNGVPIIPFLHSKLDQEFKELVPFLKRYLLEDIRELNRQTFKFNLYLNYHLPQELFNKLFSS